MSQLKLGLRLEVINDFGKHPITFFKAGTNGNLEEKTTNPAEAIAMDLRGIGRVNLAQLESVYVVKGAPGTKHKLTVTAADAAQIKLGTITEPDTPIDFKLKITSADARSEFASLTGREEQFWRDTINVDPTDTAAEVLEKLAEKINLRHTLFPETDGAGEPFTVTYADGVFTIEADDENLTLELLRDSMNRDNVRALTVFKPVVATKQSQGRGTYNVLREVIRETAGTNDFYAITQREGLPARRTLYTNLQIKTGTVREDLHGGAGAASEKIVQYPEYELYINESASNDDELDKILQFLDRAPAGAKKEYRDAADAASTSLLLQAVAPSGEQPDNPNTPND